MILGFTSGRSWDKKALIARLDNFQRIGCRAVEIGVGAQEIVSLSKVDELSQLNEMFEYVSVHAPAGNFSYKNLNQDISLLDMAIKRIKPQVVVVHPDRIVTPQLLLDLNWPLAIENLDSRSDIGKTADQLQEYFDLFPNAKTVLDLNHVFTSTPDMSLVHSLWEAFSSRVTHFHLSGHVDANAPHDFLFKTKQDGIIGALLTKDLPIILEPDISNLSPDNIQREYQYVADRIGKL